MPVSEAKKKANRAYNERTYDRLYIFVDKEQKKRIKEYVKRIGMSVNEYVTSLIEEDMLKNNPKISESLAERLYRYEFEIYKSNVSHYLKEVGDIKFLSSVISENVINEYWNRKQYKEALYMLASVDYLCRINGVPQVNDYENLRKESFEEPLFPKDVILKSRLQKNDEPKKTAMINAIPEFLRHNIIEGDLRDAV